MSTFDWFAEYRSSRARIVDMIDALDAHDAATVVPACPEWTIHDVVAHLAGLAVDLAAGRLPNGSPQPWIDDQVERRKGYPLGLLVDEWNASDIEGFIARSRNGQIVYDICSHEHDICHALNKVGERDSSTVHASLAVMTELLAKDLLAKGAPGAIRLSTNDQTWTVGEGVIGLTLEATPFELIRIFASRRSVAQMRRLPWKTTDGLPADVDPWLDAMAHFAYPAADLVE
jgi:uncharacterized protein (TIGR03083 family)